MACEPIGREEDARPSAYIGVGSNLSPEENIPKALQMLLAHPAEVVGVSAFYRTRPLGGRAGPPYANGVWRVAVAERDSPQALKRALREIETRLGRVRGADRYASRPIDLDLLLFADRVIREEGLRIPDPQIYRRPFLSIPLAELDPERVLPDSGRIVREVARLHRADGMEAMADLTEALRRLLAAEWSAGRRGMGPGLGLNRRPPSASSPGNR